MEAGTGIEPVNHCRKISRIGNSSENCINKEFVRKGGIPLNSMIFVKWYDSV